MSMDGNARPVATPSKFDLPGTTDLSISGWTQDNKIGILIPSPSAMPLYTVPSEGDVDRHRTFAVMPVLSSHACCRAPKRTLFVVAARNQQKPEFRQKEDRHDRKIFEFSADKH